MYNRRAKRKRMDIFIGGFVGITIGAISHAVVLFMYFRSANPDEAIDDLGLVLAFVSLLPIVLGAMLGAFVSTLRSPS